MSKIRFAPIGLLAGFGGHFAAAGDEKGGEEREKWEGQEGRGGREREGNKKNGKGEKGKEWGVKKRKWQGRGRAPETTFSR